MLWPELPFIDRVGLVFLLCTLTAVAISLVQKSPGQPEQEGAVDLNDIDFSTTKGFNLAAFLVGLILAAFYICWW